METTDILNAMTRGYCGEALYCKCVDDGESDETYDDAGYTEDDIAEETLHDVAEDCKLFLEKARERGIDIEKDVLPYIDAYEMGIQFYLSGELMHGNNFGTCEELPLSVGETLRDIALDIGSECYAEVDENGKVWLKAYGTA